MSGERAGEAAERTAFAYRASMFGAAREFRLTGDGLEWTVGRRSGRIPFGAVRRLRMSFKPANMQWQRFLTEVWADGTPKLEIVSTSWKSLIEQERLDQRYTAFVTELHRRIALAAAPTCFERGRSPFLYWPSLIVFAGVALVAAMLIVRALQSDAKGGAAFIAVFLALFLWQGGNFFRRNRPGLYRPDALPAELMPKG
jgi:hypothetical protein